MPQWTDALPLADLPEGAVKVRKLGATPVALFRVEGGAVHAIDNRCPHEGYPLSQGARDGCVLTCSWHNYKFDLTDDPIGDDLVLEKGKARVIIDQMSLIYMQGSEIDFVDNLMGQSFQINNPNAVASCGCGTSFAI